MNTPIYLDYAATTPVDDAVAEEMLKHLSSKRNFGNPSSQHCFGLRAEEAVEKARTLIAGYLNGKAKDIIFTSGATESNNIAIKGVVRANKAKGRHIITSVTEHKAVLDTCRALENEGFDVTYLTPDNTGLINSDQLAQAIRPDTVLVSIMHVNNETGVIQDIAALGNVVNHNSIVFHVDAAQSFGKLPIDLGNTPVDLLSCSSHKLYGPKGMGLLYIRNRSKMRITPLVDGGGQEYGIRPGTLPTHQIAGLAKAVEIAHNRIGKDLETATMLNRILRQGLARIEGATLNSPPQALPNIINISFTDIDSVTLVTSLQNDVAISSGSACTSGSIEPSHVLRGMGIEGDRLQSAVRISLGRYTTREDIEIALDMITNEVSRIRNLMN